MDKNFKNGDRIVLLLNRKSKHISVSGNTNKECAALKVCLDIFESNIAVT